MSSDRAVAERVVLVTGASSGIGAATAKAFLENGDVVYGLSRSGKAPAGVKGVAADVTDGEAVSAAIAQILSDEGRIDVLINNAGFGISGAVECTDTADAIRQFDVNLFGAARCIHAALPSMRERQSGMIINIGSVAGKLPVPFQAYYSAVKAAVGALTLALANEVRPFGVKVTALLPGDVKTGFTAARQKSIAGSGIYKSLEKSVASMEHDEQNGMPPERIAARLVQISKKKHPKGEYTCGFQYQFFLFLGKVLPVRVSNAIEGMMYS